MKKILLAIAIALAAGCTQEVEDYGSAQWVCHGCGIHTKVVEIENHKYILMRGFKCGSIIHAESCPCKKSSKQDYVKLSNMLDALR